MSIALDFGFVVVIVIAAAACLIGFLIERRFQWKIL
jgi:hypothetical protein